MQKAFFDFSSHYFERMSRIKFDSEIIKIISLFEAVTRSKVKDCIVDPEKILFIVEENEISKAIGKKGANVRLVESKLKRKIKIVEFNSNVVTFIKNLIMPLKVDEIKEDEQGLIILKSSDSKVKGLIIGRNAKNLRAYEGVVKRYFPIQEIKVM